MKQTAVKDELPNPDQGGAQQLKSIAIGVVKYGISLSILVYLLHTASQQDSFKVITDRPKNWPLLFTAFVVALGAVTLTFVRWYLLVRALDLPFRLVDACRLGFIGNTITE